MGSREPEFSFGSADFSKQLMPVVIDRIAKAEPDALFVALATGNGYKKITFSQYANAINVAAYWLEHQLGKSNMDEGLAYFGAGPCDVCYAILLIAAVKAGYHMLFNSPRNSIDAHSNLFVLQQCHTLIVPEPRPPFIDPLLAAYPMRVLQLPALEELLNSKIPHYEYNKSFHEARNYPLVSLHTSGSTGLPKPITWTLGYAAVSANAYHASDAEGNRSVQQLMRDDFIFSMMPMFHTAGLTVNVLAAVYPRHRIVLPPPGPLLSADGVISLIKSIGATAAVLPPSTLDEIGKQPHLLKTLGNLNHVMYGGGTITKAAGDAIMKKTKLLNIIGSTECGALSHMEVEQEDWAYVHFSPSAGIAFRHYSGDEFEMIIVRDERLKCYQACFEIFPDLQEIASSDLFSKHPNKPDLWLYRGRSDDVIVFLNGEKTNPVSMEGLISSRPEVRNALVIGQGRLEAALLVEPTQSSGLSIDERAILIESLWPTIQEANKACPAHARVSKSHILFTTPQKPMSRAGKGTVQRKFTLQNYSAELDALYSDASSMRHRETPIKLDVDNLEQSMLQVLILTTGITDLRVGDDFFSHGMDSLQVIQTARRLWTGLEEAGIQADNLAPSTIYTNPTAIQLAAAVKSLTQESRMSEEANEQARIEKMESVLKRYSATLTPQERQSERRNKSPEVVMLTGSTGALGSYLLDALAACKSISKIYCLNRSAEGRKRQEQSSGWRGLTSQWDDQRVTFLGSDFSKQDLGLGRSVYSKLASNVHLIIHNAWQVDFNLSLESYEQVHIRGVRNLIDLSIESTHQAGIFFVSSISSVMNWPSRHKGQVPEEVIHDSTVPSTIGYAESKHVSERLLDLAATVSNVSVSICRVGQIAGPVRSSKGMWNKQEWLPSLILSSHHLEIIPDSLGSQQDIDWIPIDVLSSIITELALGHFATYESRSTTYHTVNSNTTTWTALLPHIQAALGPEIKVVPFQVWLQQLRASTGASTSKQDLAVNPAIKLLDFYESLLSTGTATAVLDTTETQKANTRLIELGPVRGEWMARWIGQWKEDVQFADFGYKEEMGFELGRL